MKIEAVGPIKPSAYLETKKPTLNQGMGSMKKKILQGNAFQRKKES